MLSSLLWLAFIWGGEERSFQPLWDPGLKPASLTSLPGPLHPRKAGSHPASPPSLLVLCEVGQKGLGL